MVTKRLVEFKFKVLYDYLDVEGYEYHEISYGYIFIVVYGYLVIGLIIRIHT